MRVERYFARGVFAVIKKRKLRQKQVAALCGISQGYVCKLVNEQQGVTLKNAYAIAKGLNISVEKLIKLGAKE